MSHSSANPGAGQSESDDPDGGQTRKNPETTTDSHATNIKDEPSLTADETADERIVSWYTKVAKPAGHHERAEDGARNDSSLSEDWKLTPLHELVERTDDDDDGLHELERQLGQWKDILDVRSPEDQETALHMAIRKGFNEMARQLLAAGAKVNIENGSGELPLHVACDYGDQQLVEELLEKGSDPEHKDSSDIYPLHSAIIRGFGVSAVHGLLGPGRFVINETVGGAHWTPLNKAIYYRHEDVVDALLEGGASLRIKDSDGWTPLMTAIRLGLYNTFAKLLSHLEKNSTERDVVNMPDNHGVTPLMQLCTGNLKESISHIEHLLQMNPDVNATDEDEQTALHYTMASLEYSMETEAQLYGDVALKLIRSMSIKSLLHLDKDGETAFDVAFDEDEKGQELAFKPLLDSLVDRLVEGESIEEPLCWAVYRLERHPVALNLFQKNFAEEIRQDPKRGQWAIVEWAIYARMPRVLLTYLRTLGVERRVSEDDKVDKSIENGQKLVKTLKEEVRQSSTPLAEEKRRKGERGPASGADSGKDAQVLRDMEDILDYLYPEKAKKPTKPLDLSKPEKGMKSSLDRFRAAIIQSTFVKFRTIQEVLYDDGSMAHMQDIAKRLKQFEYTPNVSSEQASQTSEELRENTKARAQFTWIHLPSTNMVWMEDTAKKILKGEGCGKSEAEKVASFLRSSWIEIPDRTSTSRFMRPRYVFKETENATRQQPEDENELRDARGRGSTQTGNRSRHSKEREKPSSEDDQGGDHSISPEETSTTSGRELEEDQNSEQAVDTDRGGAEKGKSFAVSAIYVIEMPYLYFSTYHQNESGEQMAGTESPSGLEKKVQGEITARQGLFNTYKNSVIHQPTTLDEFYYQFASDKDSFEDRNTRNKDQVVTKYLRRGVDMEKERFWPLLRVSQLWIWTIDEKWLITSTSCATNDIRDNLVTDILGHLQRQVENGSRRLGPTSATEMSRVIVDYCIGTYERKRSRQNVKRNEDQRLQTDGTTTQDQPQGNTDRVNQSGTEDGKHKEERSIHQIFSDSINEIARKESSLFSLSYGRHGYAREPETGPDSHHASEIMEGLQDALNTVAVQLCQIKDIRDELNILKSIAKFQRKVQSTMAGSGAKEEFSSYYLLRDLDELDKFSNQTQEAVKTALTLRESDIASFQAQIANWQASESVRQGKESVKQGEESVKQGEQAVKQGKIVLVFTLVTVWFFSYH
ncbi:hypothetical protein NW759_004884 [Fusarium solani]|nr:hypothetical protein NW759_004884 [Fusarium solani]